MSTAQKRPWHKQVSLFYSRHPDRFLLAFMIAFLFFFCANEFGTKGFHLFDWDILLISGFVTFFLATPFAMMVPKKKNDMLLRLAQRGVLQSTPDALTTLNGDLDRRASVWAKGLGWIVSFVMMGGFLVVFRAEILSDVLVLVLLEGVAGYCAGFCLGRMCAYGTLGWLFNRPEIILQVQPGHLDGAAGLKPLGAFYFFQAMVAAIPALFLAVWSIAIPLWPYRYYDQWRYPYLGYLALAICIEVVAFLVPIWIVHQVMIQQKEVLLSQSDILSREIHQLQLELAKSQDVAQRSLLKDRLAYNVQAYMDIEQLPTWPIDATIQRRFTINNIVLFLPLLSNLIGLTGPWQQLEQIFETLLKTPPK